MPLDKSKLVIFLNGQPLLLEEKKMWFKLGFYIYPNPTMTINGISKTILIDTIGNQEAMDKTIAYNIRLAALEWWETESTTSKSNEKESTLVTSSSDALDELEVKRG